MKQLDKNIIYLHMNQAESYVLSHGITFSDIIHSLSNPIQSILLLQHKFEDVYTHLPSFFHYIEEEKIQDLIQDEVSRYGEFNWVDFENIECLDEIDGQEIAELLFLNHMKQPLRSPFFQKLNNRFVYLAQDDGWFNKTYYREIEDIYDVLGFLLKKLAEKESKQKRILFFKKSTEIVSVDQGTLKDLMKLLRNGCVIDVEKVSQLRGKIEIPIFPLGHFWNMDEMQEAYEKAKKKPDVVLTYSKKEKGWTIN